MNLPELIQTWGYGAVFAGSLFEGETLLLLGGFAAHRGHLSLPLVIGVGILGSFIGDQFYFQLGRRYGERLLARFPRLAPGAARVHALLERHHLPIILSLRFLYGLRTVGPIAIGMSKMPFARFFFLDLAGAILWATVVALAGYAFGHAFELVLGDLRRYEEILFAVLVVVGAAIWWWRRRTGKAARALR
jgi:membrane protein DedA with SNARE-associated domain